MQGRTGFLLCHLTPPEACLILGQVLESLKAEIKPALAIHHNTLWT